jgi:uncharacterized membrane protein YgaE (UPF0421/DUF939 family)
MTFSNFIPAFQLSLRAALAAGFTTAFAQIWRLHSRSRKLGIQRLAGTLLGAMFGATLSPLLHNAPWAIAIESVARAATVPMPS